MDSREEHIPADMWRGGSWEQMPPISHPLIPLRFPDDGSLAEPQQKPEGRDAEWQYFTNNLLRRDIEIGTFFPFSK